jgi:hypothetical protein
LIFFLGAYTTKERASVEPLITNKMA